MKILFSIFIALFSSLLALAQNTKPVATAEDICNFAGTITIGELIGQSNNAGPDTIFLCLGDSILIQHNGDAILTGDPVPATAAGICYGYYNCPPTISGDNLQAISSIPGPGDPCILAGALNGLFITRAVPNGNDYWFFNDNSIQQLFNAGNPLLLYHAPMTIDDWFNNDFETLKAAPGPCVNVNTDAAFPVVYLTEIYADQVSNNFGDDCLGKFRMNGGYPDYDPTAIYTLDISLDNDPATKALIHLPTPAAFDNSVTIFSITSPGIYNITVEDYVSCGLQFQLDMTGCDPGDNLVIAVDSLSGHTGEIICVPVRVDNFDISSGSFSFFWDPALLEYDSIVNPNSAIADFFSPAGFLNTSSISEGMLGALLFNTISIGDPISIPDGEILFELCFKLQDSITPCAVIDIGPNPSQIAFEDPMGGSIAITGVAGKVCFESTPVAAVEPTIQLVGKLSPNPVKSGAEVQILVKAKHSIDTKLSIRNMQGILVQEQHIYLGDGENKINISTTGLASGVYVIEMGQTRGESLGTYKLVVYE